MGTLYIPATTAMAEPLPGEAGFAANCASCHRDGGNSINPARTLRRMTMHANGIKSARDIVRKMRNPGPGMPRFDKKELSDKEALQIAEYILKSFD
jgi:cytochrome c6